MTSKLPSFQFYPGDWMKDPALRSCSPAARGVWMDMLCLMFESTRRGFLQAPNGKSYSPEQIARMTGCSTDEVSRLLEELENSGVYSRTTRGIIFSRRIVREEEIRSDQRARQEKYRKSLKDKDNGDGSVMEEVTQPSQPLSSSSSSSTSVPYETPNGVSSGELEKTPVKLLGTLPLNDGSLFEINAVMVEEWESLYPAVDVRQQCRSMKGWCISHPTQLKTRRGVMKFITGWLSREQDKGPQGRNGGNGNGRSNDPRTVTQSVQDVIGRARAGTSSNSGSVCSPQQSSNGSDVGDLLLNAFVGSESRASEEPNPKVIEGMPLLAKCG